MEFTRIRLKLLQSSSEGKVATPNTSNHMACVQTSCARERGDGGGGPIRHAWMNDTLHNFHKTHDRKGRDRTRG